MEHDYSCRTRRYPESMSFVFNPAGLVALTTNPVGGIARELERQGERIVVAAQNYVGTPWVSGTSDPPQPFLRSGNLQDSIRAIEPLVINGVLQVQVWADPVNDRDGYPYAPWLREHGFKFVDLDALG